MSDNPLEQYREYLSQAGRRLTREQQRVVLAAFTIPPPFTAEQVVAIADSDRVSRSTVYRTLLDLQKCGLITRHSSTEDGDAYTHDFPVPVVAVQEPSSLCALTHRSLIVGTCPWCGRPVIGGEVQ